MRGTPSYAHDTFLFPMKYISISVTISLRKLQLKSSTFTEKNLLQTLKPCIQHYLRCNRKKDAKNLISIQKKAAQVTFD